MDTGFLNFNEEHFSFDYLDQINYEENTSTTSTTQWHDDDLPGCSFFSNIKDITETLPSDFFNIDVLNGDTDGLPPLFDPSIRIETSPSSVSSPSSSSSLSSRSLSTNDDFYFMNYLNEPLEQQPQQQQCSQTIIKRTIKAPVKKIDKEACKYIIEDDDKDKNIDDDDDDNDSCNNDDLVDVVTVSEDESPKVLEASDPIGLLEQFEASEKSSSSIIQQLKQSLNSTSNNNNKNSDDSSHDIHILDKIPPNPIQIFADDNNLTNRLENNDGNNKVNNTTILDVKIETEKDNSINTRQQTNKLSNNIVNNNNNNNSKNQQIRDALPQELIARINESGKRKTITVIPPIPNKKRCNNSRTFEAIQRSKINKLINQHNIMNDHDYCKTLTSSSSSSSISKSTNVAISAVYPKEPQKDSGFESTEEDEQQQQQPSIGNQPLIKNEDGKLMVSLLKVNTINSNSGGGSSNNNNNNNNTQKKKLKLEEYKKRRPISTKSQSNSPINSSCRSPLPEDENLKRIKHQEKLMKMAEELLNTPPKSVLSSSSSKTTNEIDNKDNKQLVDEKIKDNNEQLVKEIPQPPPDMEMKSFVSVGVNTEIYSDQNLLTNIDELNEIQPLLQKVSDKINSNSFITSLIENLPKVKRKTTITTTTNDKETQIDKDKLESVRENLVVVWLPKKRPIKKTVDTEIQTTISLIGEETQSRYRRRLISDSDGSISSSSSSSSSSSRSSSVSVSSTKRRSRKRHRSRGISSSNSSRSRSRSKSRSRSRQCKIYKKQKRNRITAEQIAEVQERRVIYVGRLEDGLNGEDLIRKFKHFGSITHASVHPRKNGESYGFVTFVNKEDAYEAIEHGNDVYGYEKYDLSFGGRRIFCQTTYSDLDDMREDDYNYYHISKENEESFDSLLRAFLTLRKRKP